MNLSKQRALDIQVWRIGLRKWPQTIMRSIFLSCVSVNTIYSVKPPPSCWVIRYFILIPMKLVNVDLSTYWLSLRNVSLYGCQMALAVTAFSIITEDLYLLQIKFCYVNPESNVLPLFTRDYSHNFGIHQRHGESRSSYIKLMSLTCYCVAWLQISLLDLCAVWIKIHARPFL